jgi:hypothetical protein
MRLKDVIAFFLVLSIVFLLFFYWIFPLQGREFEITYRTGNFSINETPDEIQFYQNMRYFRKEISYHISKECNLQKKDEMKRAFKILQEKTILSFYSVEENQEISVLCEERDVIKNRVFIAGEGGPTKISNVGEVNIIHEGMILLIRSSNCPEPNIALHELLHALGFDHSPNPKNIMYNFTRCDQEIGDDIISLINELYSIPSYPDLSLGEVFVKLDGMVLKFNVSVKNIGLGDSEDSTLITYSNGEKISEIEIKSLLPGQGIKIYWEKTFLKPSPEKLSFLIKHDLQEISKENNKITFKLKK